jgi:hypothetical protein
LALECTPIDGFNDDDWEAGFAAGRRPSRTYFTSRFRNDPARRFAVKVWDEPDAPRFEWVEGARQALLETDPERVVTVRHEAVLRVTPVADHRYQLKAVFLEGTREVERVIVQQFTEESGKPHRKNQFAMSWEQTQRLLQFFRAIRYARLSDDGEKVRFDDGLLDDLLEDDAARARFVRDHADLVQKLIDDAGAVRRARAVVDPGTAQEVVDVIARKGFTVEVLRLLSESALTDGDVFTLAHRRRQLGVFESLLRDPAAFAARRSELGRNARPEDVWQRFFEANQWILGYGLRYQFGTSVSVERLEQTVAGARVGAHGKRVDALLRTLGTVNSLCFVELKNHDAPLLVNREVRSGVIPPSSDLVAAVTQVQQTVQAAVTTLGETLRVSDEAGFEDPKPLFNIAPKALVIIGSLEQFVGQGRLNHDRIKCFELFRRSIGNPEIITYDELFERARAIVEGEPVEPSPAEPEDDDIPF